MISWWECNIKICSKAMNTGRKVKIGFLGSKYGLVGGGLDHSNQPFDSITERYFLTIWQSVYQECSRSVTGIRTLYEHLSGLSSGVWSHLNLTIRQKETSQCLPDLEHWFLSLFWVFSKIFFLLFSFKELGNWRPILAVILRLDTLSWSKTTLTL